MSTLLSTPCGQIPTFLFCLPTAKREIPLAAVVPAAPLTPNTYQAVKGGTVLNEVPLPSTGVLGDRIAILYEGGNVALMTPPIAPATVGTTVYTFDPVGDLNKVILLRFDGLAWVLA